MHLAFAFAYVRVEECLHVRKFLGVILSVKLHYSNRNDITTQRINTKLVMCIGFMTLKYVIVVQKAQYVQS